MSKFSDFISNASPEEKEKVYMDVMEKATERQLSDEYRVLFLAHEELKRERDALRHDLEKAISNHNADLSAAPICKCQNGKGISGKRE